MIQTATKPKVYTYRDANGQIAYEYVRYDEPWNKDKPKRFVARRPDGNGGYINNLGGVTHILYRLPELLNASPDTIIYIPEGEKCVDILANMGLVATSNDNGAGCWRDEYSQYLKNRHVVILPDNDQAGRKHAQTIAKSLTSIAASIKIVELPALREKGDVFDFLTTNGEVDFTTEDALKTVISICEQAKAESNGADHRANGQNTAEQQDTNAQAYILGLKTGIKPDTMPDVGKWRQCIQHFITVYDEAPEDKAQAVGYVITSFIGSGKYPGLKELLSDKKGTPNGIPPLPESARIPTSFLPLPSENPKENWLSQWDRSQLKQVSPWLVAFIAYSYDLSPEAPVGFHIAVGLWALSTVAARRVYVAVGKRVYPMLAVALVSRSSIYAKSDTALAAIKVLNAAGLGWLLGGDETTPQMLLADMAGVVPSNYSDIQDEDLKQRIKQRVAMSGQIGWYYDEFNQLIDAMTRPGPMAEFAGLLRKLDNCPDTYIYSTRSHGRETIEKPYLSLLASTTPANLRKHAAKGATFWNDGFWARFAFITPRPQEYKTKTRKKGEVQVPSSLTAPLRAWNERMEVPKCTIEAATDEKGKPTGKHTVTRDPLPSHELEFDDEAYEAYVQYREALRDLINNGKNEDLDASYARMSDKALRIAVLIASLENHNRIDPTIWALAQEIAELFRRNLHELYSQVTAEKETAFDLELQIHKKINDSHPATLTANEIRCTSRRFRALPPARFEEMIKSLEKSGAIKAIREDGVTKYGLSLAGVAAKEY